MTPDLFIAQLREAHSIMQAYNRGATSVQELASRTGFPANICANWVRILRLSIESPLPKHRSYYRIPPRKSPEPKLTFDI